MMKRILLSLLFVAYWATSYGQCTITFNENFDGVVLMTGTGTPGWLPDATLQVSSPNSYRGRFATGDTSRLTSPCFSTLGNAEVTLDFDHICKSNLFDRAILEVSTDCGLNWTKVIASTWNQIKTGSEPPNNNAIYRGSSIIYSNPTVGNFSFSAFCYPDWDATNAGTTPTNSWWKHETFDLSHLLGNQANVMIRFSFYDGDLNGLSGNYGWLLDNISVCMNVCKVPPVINMGTVEIQGNLYSPGPFSDTFTVVDTTNVHFDPNTICYTEIEYSINGVSQGGIGGYFPGPDDSTFQYTIHPFNIPFNLGDSVCYYFYSYDCSACMSTDTSAQYCFVIKEGIMLPNCENFETAAKWTATTISGSAWEYGTPAFGTTNSAHTPVNAWDVSLASGYTNNTQTYVTSKVYSFINGQNPKLKVWVNYNTQQGVDGAHIEYSTDLGNSWNVLGNGPNDPNGVNWYTDASLVSSGVGGWSGNSLGWKEAAYDLHSIPALIGASTVQFRFVFKSDGSTTGDGFSFDDFCINLPPNCDVGVSAVTFPLDGTGTSVGAVIGPIQIEVTNFGNASPAISGLPILCEVNGVVVSTSSTFSGSLPIMQPIPFVLDTFLAPGATFNLCCYTALGCDGDNTNDTSCNTIIIVPTLTLPYCDDFESANVGWISDFEPTGNLSDKWELGTPNFGATSGAHSGTNAWDINLNGFLDAFGDSVGYNNLAYVHLFSPYFDFSQAASARLEFWHNFNAENTWDGMNIWYSINGIDWFILGAAANPNPDPNGTNWYNTLNVNSWGFGNNVSGWTGNSNGWVSSAYKLCGNPDLNNQANPVQFRFTFRSDGSVLSDGYSIDDFCILSSATDDIGVSNIVAPANAAPSGASINITVTVTNYGGTTLNGFPVAYTINGVLPPTVYNAPDVLPPCSSVDITFPIPFVVPGTTFDLCAFTQLPTDADLSNDTLCNTVLSIPTLTPAYCDNFDAGVIWYTDNLGDPLTNWELGTPNFQTTTGANSPPNAWDINLNSGYEADADAILYSPYFDFAAVVNGTLSFWQNREIDQFGGDGMYVEYTTDNGANWFVLGGVNDPDGVNWYNFTGTVNNTPGWNGNSSGNFGVPLWVKSSYNLNAFSNTPTMQFRFRFVSGPFAAGTGVSVDDFCITVPPPQDAGIPAIVTPSGISLGLLTTNSTTNLNVVLKNFGSQSFSATTINWSCAGCVGTPGGTFSWSGAPLTPNSTIQVNNIGVVTTGNNDVDICAWTTLPGDGDPSNDTSCNAINVVPSYTVTYLQPYVESFDVTDGGWYSTIDQSGDPGSIWEWGNPNYGVTTGSHTAPFCWDVNLNTPYTSDAFTYLYSPFFDLANAVDARISFWHNYATEGTWDGTRMEYSFDGTTWSILGTGPVGFPVLPDSCGINWFTDNFLNSTNLPGWEGAAGWVKSEYDLNCWDAGFDNSGLVQFRFVFNADGFAEVDGYSIDDFRVDVPVPVSIAPLSIDVTMQNPAGSHLLFPSLPITFTAPIKNQGTQTANTCNATLKVDTQVLATESVTFSPGLLKDSLQYYTFNQTWTGGPGIHTVCVYTDNPNGTQDLNTVDDTICTVFTVFDSTTISPYCNDFESGSQWVTANAITYLPTNSWQLGTPAKPSLNSTHSGSNAWATRLSGNYAPRDSSGLFSPVFFVLSNHCYKLSFWHNFKMEEFQDGAIVQYSTNKGASWTTIDFNKVYGNGDKYDYVYALSSFQNFVNGFTGNNTAWKFDEKIIRPGITAPLIIRWRFGSDESRQDEGWVIDDVCFTDLGTCGPLGIDEVSQTGLGLGQNYPNPFNGLTTIEYMTPKDGAIELYITDALGRTVSIIENNNQIAGEYKVEFNSEMLKPGIYFYTLVFDGERITKRMIISE